jgi:hypothetical protein
MTPAFIEAVEAYVEAKERFRHCGVGYVEELRHRRNDAAIRVADLAAEMVKEGKTT